MTSQAVQRIISRRPRRRDDGVVLTDEQKAVVECQSHCVLVRAYAGSGKTTVLRVYAERRPRQRFVYICFNKAIQLAASKVFPPNVKCVTFDALAYRRYVHGYKTEADTRGGTRPLSGVFISTLLRGSSFRKRDGSRLQIPFLTCRHIALTLQLFAKSVVDAKDGKVHTHHVPEDVRKALNEDAAAISHVKQLAQWVWRKYQRRQSPYVCFDLNRLVLWAEGLTREVDVETALLVDEGQDLNAPMAATLMSAPHKAVIVGDRYQQIYGTFMGSVNVMRRFHRSGTHLFELTQSFRFGQKLASLLARMLNLIDAHPSVRQRHQPGVRLRGLDYRETRIMRADEPMETPFVALFRTNRKLFARAFLFAKQDLRIHIFGWKTMRLQLLAAKPVLGNTTAATTEEDESFGVARIIERFEPEKLHDMIRAIDGHHVDEPSKADITLSTIHKYKGAEASRVWVHNDIQLKTVFQFTHDAQTGRPCVVWSLKEREEMHLVYVALSRAIDQLRVDYDIEHYVYEAENMQCGAAPGVVMPEDTSVPTAIRCIRTGEQPRTLYLLKQATNGKRSSG